MFRVRVDKYLVLVLILSTVLFLRIFNKESTSQAPSESQLGAHKNEKQYEIKTDTNNKLILLYHPLWKHEYWYLPFARLAHLISSLLNLTFKFVDWAIKTIFRT